MKTFAICCLILIATCAPALAQREKKPQADTRGIRAYDMRITGLVPDTAAAGDSAVVTVEMYLDCTNTITRTETRSDTSGSRRIMLLSVYGTFIEGPHHPLCAAQRIVKELTVSFPVPGTWSVEASPARTGRGPLRRWVVTVR